MPETNNTKIVSTEDPEVKDVVYYSAFLFQFMSLVFKKWCISIAWKLVRNAQSLTPTHSYWTRMCILTQPPGVHSHAHSSLRSHATPDFENAGAQRQETERDPREPPWVFRGGPQGVLPGTLHQRSIPAPVNLQSPWPWSAADTECSDQGQQLKASPPSMFVRHTATHEFTTVAAFVPRPQCWEACKAHSIDHRPLWRKCDDILVKPEPTAGRRNNRETGVDGNGEASPILPVWGRDEE